MGSRISRYGYPGAALAALGTVLALVLIYHGATSPGDFDVHNPSWEGASRLPGLLERSGGDTETVRNVSGYAGAGEGSAALILSPGTPYREGEVEELRRYLDRGGTLVVAEDYGQHSNGLLRDLGVSARFAGDPVRDDREHFRSPDLPVARVVAPDLAAEDVTLNHGTAVEPGEATPVAKTSRFAYADVDRDGELDPDEEVGERVVVARERVGGGTVVLVGDPSVFINAMLDAGNAGFVRELLSRDRVLLDRSHAPPPPLLHRLRDLARSGPAVEVLTGSAALLLTGAMIRMCRQGRRKWSVSRDGVRDLLTRSHPEAERAEVERVADAVARGKIEGGTEGRDRHDGG